MISKESLIAEWIDNVSKANRSANKILIERLICFALLIVLSVDNGYTQGKKIQIDQNDLGYYNVRSDVAKKSHLPDMTVINDGRHWRFWYDKYIACSFVIDVTGTDSLHCKAFITMYTYGDVIWNEKDRFGKLYHEQVNLDSYAACTLYRAATGINIGRFARRDTLENSSVRVYETLDSYPATVEYADDKNFIFKTGLRPENIAQFKTIIDSAKAVVNFEKLKDSFEKKIPFGYYSSDKWMYIQLKLTSKQIRKYNRYWRKHAA